MNTLWKPTPGDIYDEDVVTMVEWLRQKRQPPGDEESWAEEQGIPMNISIPCNSELQYEKKRAEKEEEGKKAAAAAATTTAMKKKKTKTKKVKAAAGSKKQLDQDGDGDDDDDDDEPDQKKIKKQEKDDTSTKKTKKEEKKKEEEKEPEVVYLETIQSMVRTPWQLIKTHCQVDQRKGIQIGFMAGDIHFAALRIEADFDSKSLRLELFDSMKYVTVAYEKTVTFIKQEAEHDGWHVAVNCQCLHWQDQGVRWQKNRCGFFTAWAMNLLFTGIVPDKTNGPSEENMMEIDRKSVV